MGQGLQLAFQAAARTRLTERQREVLEALTDDFALPDDIGARAKLTTASPCETAATYCRQLVKLGLAEKGGTPMRPKWRRAK